MFSAVILKANITVLIQFNQQQTKITKHKQKVLLKLVMNTKLCNLY